MADDIYQRAFRVYGASPKSLHWANYPSQAVRFKNLVKDLDLENKSILDAGCGMGDILPFIYARADHFDYLGVDINKDFIEIAKTRYAGHKFKVADPFKGLNLGIHHYDVVLCSGVMNENIDNWQEVRRKMIKSLFKLARQTLAFNMAGSFSHIPPDSKIAYASAQEIMDFCLSLTPSVALSSDYSAYDFTVVMRK
jgi:SAM-dependent methyltransferase